MVQASLEADPHAAAHPGALPPVLGEPGLARPPSSEDIEAWGRLDRLQGPGERRAVLLALALTPGSPHEQQAWVDECQGVTQAGLAHELVKRLSPLARPAALERVLQDCHNAPKAERVELLRSARRLMCADGRVGPLDRLRWLYMRQCLGSSEPGVGGPQMRALRVDMNDDGSQGDPAAADRVGAHALPEALKLPASRLTSYLARMVPLTDAQSKVGSLGVAWHRAVLTQLWGDGISPCRLPDSDQLVLALAQVQEMSWMQRPLLTRTWVDMAFALARHRPAVRPAAPEAGAAPDPLPPGLPEVEALQALRLACRMIDTPLPPELARVFIEHPKHAPTTA
jgi:hypothetical protein